MFFRNPIPVAVVLVPVDHGILAVRRGIPPQQGQLALPGGFVDWQESWQQAACREVREETSLQLVPDELTLLDAVSVDAGHLLLFSRSHPRRHQDIDWEYSNHEVEQLAWITAPLTLAFPTHTDQLKGHFANT